MERGFEGINFIHVRTATGGAITVAVCDKNIFRNPIPEGHVSMGVAFCNPRDQFSRAVGRRVAVRKMSKAPNIVPRHIMFIGGILSPTIAFEEVICRNWSSVPIWLRDEAGGRPAEHYVALLWSGFRCHRKRKRGVA